MQKHLKLLVLLACLVLIAAPVFAQTISGDLVGTVTDPQGAVVPGATVTATNVDTGVKTTTTTNESGAFRIPNLPVGRYDIKASGSNFKETTLKGYSIELNKTSTVKLALATGSVETTIDVTEQATQLDTSTPQLQSTFEVRQTQNLPSATIGSGVLNLSLLNAGVGSSGGLGAGTGPSVSGQRPRNNNFNIEGIDNNNRSVTGPLVYVPNDAVQNFTVLQNQFSPEFGHSTGGQFNTVVMSGTNQYHGRLYEYFQNRNLNAIDVRNSKLTENPRYDNNRFGGQIGGPIIHDKLFFFGNFEYNPIGQASNAGALITPTAAGLAVIDSLSGISATNKQILKTYVPAAPVNNEGLICVQCPTDASGNPIPNVPVGDLTLTSPNFQNGYYLTTSMDYNMSNNDQIRGRYIYNKVSGLDVAADFPQFYTSAPTKYHLVALNEYHTFSPSVQNELRLGYNRYYNVTAVGNQAYPGLDSFPNIQIDELGINIGPDPNAPQFTIQNTYQWVDNISWTKGNHQFKFGYEGRRIISPQSFTQRSRGDYEYQTLNQWLIDHSPDSFGERSVGNPIYYGNMWSHYFFGNDVWKLRSNFTLNLGLRYEYDTPTLGETTQALNQAASVPGLISFAKPKGQKDKFMPRVGFAWSPGSSQTMSVRGGFAMAYDVLYDNIGILSLPPQLSGTQDVDITADTPNFLANGGLPPAASSITTFPNVAVQRAATANQIPVDRQYPYSLTWNLGVQKQFAKSYTAEVRYVGTRGVHLNVQERMNVQSPLDYKGASLPTYLSAPTQAQLDALPVTLNQLRATDTTCGQGCRYVPEYVAAGFGGTSAQFCALRPDQCALGNVNFPFLVSFRPYGGSVYHGLQSQLNRTFTNGLQFQGAYTWSHTIDDSTADFFSTVLSPRRMQDFQNLHADRGTSALDRRHRFTMALLYQPQWFKTGNWFEKNILGNWTVAPIYTFESPQYATVRSGIDSNLNGDSAGDRTIFNPNGRPGTGSGVTPLTNSSGQVVAYLAKDPTAQYIVAGAGVQPTAGRNTLRTRPINNWDFTVGKKFSITERTGIEFQAQAYNLFNHPQFVAGRINDVSPSTLVDITGLDVTNYLRADQPEFNHPEKVFSSNPRQLQLVLKFTF